MKVRGRPVVDEDKKITPVSSGDRDVGTRGSSKDWYYNNVNGKLRTSVSGGKEKIQGVSGSKEVRLEY